MADPLEQLSDSDLQALSKNDMNSMSDEGLKIVAATGNKAPAQDQKEEPLGHWAIRKGLPLLGTVAGGLAGEGVASIPLAAAGNAVGSEAAGWLNHAIYDDQAPTYNSAEDAKRIAMNAGEGALTEVGGKVLGAGFNSLIAKPITSFAGGAEKLAEAATGAPEVAQGMGRELLDNGMVKFGDTQSQIASRLSEAPAPRDVFDPFIKKQTTLGTDFSKVADAAKDVKPDSKMLGGVVDMGLISAAASGHPISALAGYGLKKIVAPRAMSSLAATADGLSQILEKTPEVLGKWAPVLAKAAARGEISLNASAYLLQQQDPEFRQKMMELNSRGSSEN